MAKQNELILFTPGPVMMSCSTKNKGSFQVPYFRNEEFSSIMKNVETDILEVVNAKPGSRVITLTSSGTGAMDASVAGIITNDDVSLVINGGSFGNRFYEILSHYRFRNINHCLEYGKALNVDELDQYQDLQITTLFVNHNETSTGNLYDLHSINEFCVSKDLFFVVDAIGSFLADPIDLSKLDVDVLIISSHKGLALPPGLSFLVLSERAITRIHRTTSRSYYFDLKKALADNERGQTPWTPALSIIYQLEDKLRFIKKKGVNQCVSDTMELANDFRDKISSLPLTLFSESPSNAVTALKITNEILHPEFIIERLLSDWNIYACPNGGELGKIIFRIGHLGDLSTSDNTKLITALTIIFGEVK